MQSIPSQTVDHINNRSLVDRVDRLLHGAILASIFLVAVCSPISIAATQTAWAIGLVLWLARLALRRGPKPRSTPIDYPLAVFLTLTLLSTFLSYDRAVSIGRLPAVLLFTVAYLIVQNVTSRWIVTALAITLIASSFVTAIYVLGDRLIGRGVKVDRLSTAGILQQVGMKDKDTILAVNGVKVKSPQDVLDQMNSAGAEGGEVRIYRLEFEHSLRFPRQAVPLMSEDLGLEEWSRGRDWRAAGFFGHYTTYADVSQVIGSLAFGLLVCLRRKISITGVVALLAVVAITSGLFLTFTRAPWLAFLVSVTIILVVGAPRRAAIAVLAILLLTVPLGLYALREKRNIGFIDPSDTSTSWRQAVWREGFNLLVSNPRHLLVGIGTDSLTRRELTSRWGLFDDGRLPPGHMHSNFLGLALDRGIPALLAWMVLLGVYARMLFKLVRVNAETNWIERGVSLGALGGLAGFVLSGVVHYNWIDSEVVTILYFIMGLNLTLAKLSEN